MAEKPVDPGAKEDGRETGVLSVRVESAIREVRGERVILDSDLAALYEVETKRLNEQVKRNADRFGPRYAFQLAAEEFEQLRAQTAAPGGRGGRRSLPWVFTEHGVVMAATVLDSDRAVAASRFIVEVFVELKRRIQGTTAALPAIARPVPVGGPSALERITVLGGGLGARLRQALDQLLDSVVNTQSQATVREEAANVIAESIQALRERLKKGGLENDEIASRVGKLLAEAEKEKALAAKTRAEAEALEFATTIRKLRLLLEAQRAIESDRIDEFLGVLREMGGGS